MIDPFKTLLTIFYLSSFLTGTNAFAEVKVFEAEAVHAMGVNDTRENAQRIAVLEASRKAAELIDAYVSDLPQVKEHGLSKDEVAAYSAGSKMETRREERGAATGLRFALVRYRIDTDLFRNGSAVP
jgi:hypothetical protein